MMSRLGACNGLEFGCLGEDGLDINGLTLDVV
jgi:hypothetical protein